MKKIILAIILIVAIDLGLTSYVGSQTERAYLNTIHLINSSPNMSAKLISYKKGFFNAQAVTQIQQGQDTFILNDHILHGPIVIDKNFPFIRFCLGLVKSHVSPSPLNTPINAEIIFSYFGGAKLKTSSNAFLYQDKDTILEGSGWKGYGKINSNFTQYTFENVVPLMVIRNKSYQNNGTEIKNAKLRIEYSKGENEDKFKIAYKIDEIRTIDQNASLTNLNLIGDFITHLETFDSRVDFNFEKLNIQSREFGPATVQFQIENLDKKLLNLLAKKENTLQNNQTSSAVNQDIMNQEKMNQGIMNQEMVEQGAINQEIMNQGGSTILQTSAQETSDIIFLKALQRVITLTINQIEIILPEGKLSLQSQAKIGNENLELPLTLDKIFQSIKGNIVLSLPRNMFEAFVEGYVKASLENDPNYTKLLDSEKMTRFNDEKDNLIESLKKSEILTETNEIAIIRFSNTNQ